MERRLIDCPETQKREHIGFQRTPLGIVIERCSRFDPPCAVTCGGTCARLLDQRDRRGVDDVEPRVLVAYAGGDRSLAAIAAALAVHLSSDQLTVELADIQTGCAPPPADYDAVVIGAFVTRNGPSRSILDFIAEHRDELSTIPSYAFVVGTELDLVTLRAASKWTPRASVVFGTTPAADRVTSVRTFALQIAEDIPAPELLVTMAPARKRIATKRP